MLCLVTRAITAAQARLPSSAPPPRRHHRRPCSSLVRAAGEWVVRVGGVGARVDPAHPLRGRTRASLLTYPGWAPPRYPPRRGARSILGVGEEGSSSRATSRGPRPGPREPRKSEAAARASGGAAGAGASARGRRAAFMSSMPRSVWLATLQRAALAMCQLPRPWRSRNARRSCARAEAPVAPEQARAAATHKRATNSMFVPGSFAARFTTEALFLLGPAACCELKVNKFQRDQQLPESHATSHGR